jgi:hypothetical protein
VGSAVNIEFTANPLRNAPSSSTHGYTSSVQLSVPLEAECTSINMIQSQPLLLSMSIE